jgi:hypothetical protein
VSKSQIHGIPIAWFISMPTPSLGMFTHLYSAALPFKDASIATSIVPYKDILPTGILQAFIKSHKKRNEPSV